MNIWIQVSFLKYVNSVRVRYDNSVTVFSWQWLIWVRHQFKTYKMPKQLNFVHTKGHIIIIFNNDMNIWMQVMF